MIKMKVVKSGDVISHKPEALGQCIPPPRHVSRGCLSQAGDVVTS